MHALSRWLEAVGLRHLESLLADNGIAEDVLTSLTERDLVELGLSIGDRKRMLKAIDELKAVEVRASAPRASTGELRQLTILLCDLVGSTTICESLPPEQWREVVLAYQQTCSALIERYGGSIAQYLGDGLLIYFGHPQAHEDAPERAVRTALSLVEAVRNLQLEPLASTDQRLRVRIGIHTGQVVIGDIGSSARREHLALGDTPNVAARLQALAAPDTVVVSDATRRMAGGSFSYTDLGLHELKGAREPRQLWRVDAILDTASRFEAATRTGLSPLVGRTQALALLGERWEIAQRGRGQTVLLSGEPGVGKSRLLKELCDRLGNAGLGTVRLQCSAHHVQIAFHPSIASIQRTLRLTPEQPVSFKLDRLESLVIDQYGLGRTQAALLASMLSLPGEERYGPLVGSAHEHEGQIISALIALSHARSRVAPTLMVIEDAHWADPATIALIHALIERTTDHRFMLVITHRPEFQLPAALASRDHVTSIKVSPLGREEVTDLVRRLAGTMPLPDDVLQHIVDKTDGVPLFVEELTRFVLEEAPASSAPNARREVPATLRDSLMARLDRDPRAKEIAQVGAVLGREFRRDVLQAIAGMTASELDDALSALTQAGLATEEVRQQGRVYAFRHALIQDTSYDSLLVSRRKELHAAVVTALEDRFPAVVASEPELLARHANAAGRPDLAIPYFRRASDLAVQRLALQEAAAHMSSALDACAAVAPSPERNRTEIELLSSLGTVHMLHRGWAAKEVSHAFARANALASTTDDVEEAIWPLWGVCVFHMVHGEIARAMSIGERMLTVARQSGSRNAWLVADMMHVQLHMYAGSFARVQMHVDHVLHRYCDPQDRALVSLYSTDLKLVTMVHGSQTRLFMGLSDGADALCTEQESFASSLDHPYSTAWVLTWGAMSFLFRGQTGELLPRVEEGLRIAEKHGFAYVAAMAHVQKGWAYARERRLDEGITLMQRGLAAFKETGAGIAVPFFTVLLAEACGRAGRRAEALSMLDEAERLVEWGGERWHEAELHRVRGQLLAAGSGADRVAAEASFRRAIEVATTQEAHEWRSRALRDLAKLSE